MKVKSITLSGAEQEVKVSGGFHVYVMNLGSSELLVSRAKGTAKGKDGTYVIPANMGITIQDVCSMTTENDVSDYRGTLYLKGSGFVQLITTNSFNFNVTQKGGDGSGSTVENNVAVKGTVSTKEDLPSTANTGDLYFVGNSGTADVEEYIYSGIAWVSIGGSGITMTEIEDKFVTKDTFDSTIAEIEKKFGNIVTIKGVLSSVDDLPKEATAGDLYFVGNASSKEGLAEYVYTTDLWEKLGTTDFDMSELEETFVSKETFDSTTSDLSDNISDNTSNITSLTSSVSANTKSISTMNKTLEAHTTAINIVANTIAGTVSLTEDSSVAVAKTIPLGDKPKTGLTEKFIVKSIGGASYTHNYLRTPKLTEQVVKGVTFTPVYDGDILLYIEANGVATTNSNSSYVVCRGTLGAELEGYYASAGTFSEGYFGVELNESPWTSVASGVGTTISQIKGVLPDKTYNFYIQIRAGKRADNVRFYPMVTKEPYISHYYPWNDILSPVTKIISHGRNIFDTSLIDPNFPCTINADGSIQWQSTTRTFLNYNFKPNTQYTFIVETKTTSGCNGRLVINYTDGTLNNTSLLNTGQDYATRTLITPENTTVNYVSVDYGRAGTTTIKNLSIVEGISGTIYDSIVKEYKVPDEILNLPAYGAGLPDTEYSNTVDFEAETYTQKVDIIDLSTLTYAKSSIVSNGLYVSSVNLSTSYNADYTVEGASDIYTVTTNWDDITNGVDNTMMLNSDGKLYICDKGVASAEALTTKLKGVKYAFALTTSKTTHITSILAPMNGERGGSIIFGSKYNQAVPATILI